MKRYIEFPLETGGTIVVEVDDEISDAGAGPASRHGEMMEKATHTFEAAIERIRPVAMTIVTKLRDIGDSPDEIAVEFGIKLNGTLGAFVASSEVEANYKVTLTWKSKSASPLAR